MVSKSGILDNWCTTEFETFRTTFQWVITNLSGGPEETGQVIQSSTFSCDKDISTKWRLEVYPYGSTENNKEFLSIFIKLVESDREKVLAQVALGIVECQPTHRLLSKRNYEVGRGWGYGQYISRSELINKMLRKDVLTVLCGVKYSGKCKTTSGRNIALKRSHSKLLDDMTALYETPNDSDIEIVVKGHKFSAHKLILKARSSVFAAMFTNEMEENQQNKVVIEDIEKEIFSKVLRYIYTDSVVNVNIGSSLKLLSAADKYNLDDLKSICEEYIGSQLTVESVCYVLIRADSHSVQELKGKAIAFIKKNRNEVTKTKGWAKVINYRSDLLDLF